MITIGIDGNEANEDKRVGIHMYAYKLLHALNKVNLSSERKISFKIFLKAKPKSDLPEENTFWSYKILHSDSFWILKKLMPQLLFREKLDLFFSPSHYLPLLSSCPMICAITDLGYLKNPEQFSRKDYWQLRYWSAISMFLAKRIIAISKSTAKDIVRQYSFTRNKVSITYLGYDEDQFNLNISENLVRQTIRELQIPKDYILYLGTLKPSKNIEGLIEGFSSLNYKHYRIHLVIAGKKGWLYESIFKKVKKLKLEERVIFTDYIKEEQKAPLLKGARAFVLPSFWEGFGIDVLSAFAVGTPVIISDVGSLPEVGGNAAIYINPRSPDSIAKAIAYVLDLSPKEYNNLVQKGLSQLSHFSWEKTARETVSIMNKVIYQK